METKSTTVFSAAIPVFELLDKHNNYPEWAIRMRTYLKGQDLWKVIIDKDENAPTYENDDVNDNGADDDAAAAIKVWRRRNYMALHVIQISCGPDAFAEIRSFCSAKTAWQTLEKKYLIVLDTGNIGKSYLQYADLYRAVHRGNLTATKDFLDSQREAVSKAITNKGQTALHIAVTTGHAHIVKELVSRMSKEDFGIEDGDGYTALTTALVYERSELALYLYTFTLLNHGDLLVEKGRKGAMLLNHAIYSRNLDLALHLIRHFPSLTHAFDDRGESPLLALASMRNAFPSGNRLVFWKQWIYNRICIHPSALGTTIETRLNTPNVESGRQHNQVIQMESGNQSAPATFETRLRIPNVENGRQRNKVITRIKSVTAVLLRRLISVVLCLWAVPAVLLRCLISVVLYLWAAPVLRRDLSLSIHVSDLLEAILPLLERLWSINLVLLVLSLHLTPILLAAIVKAIVQLYVMKKLHKQSQKLLSCMCEEISTSFIQTGQLENIGGVCDAITLAVKNGISEFVLKVARTHPSFLKNKYRNSRNILMLAVLYRQSEIFSNIYYGFDMENTLTSYGDCNDDNILHMVGMIEDSTMLNQISGAALQMQRELQWFKKMSSQNKENRRKQTVNHTSGRTSFVVLMERKKDKNLIDFYKDVHWSNKKERFITPTIEENYNQMVQLMNAKEPEARIDEASAMIFREVLGHRSGYSRGMGHSVMPESTKVAGVSNEEYERLAEENEANRKSAEYYQNRLQDIEGGFAAMREHMRDYEQRVNMRMSKVETNQFESRIETQAADP